MSDPVKHECAVALLKLRKPNDYFSRKYGSNAYGFNKLALLLEKQHNRGQDGAGMACVRPSPQPGEPCYALEKSVAGTPLADLLVRIGASIDAGDETFLGDCMLGHLRYATFGKDDINACHPFVRNGSCLNRTLLLAGNFNITDTQDILAYLVKTGHHPASRSDGELILQLLMHYVDKSIGAANRPCDFADALRKMAAHIDGAFTLCGVTGEGHAFALRDAHAIRPAFFYFDEEVVVVTSERPAIQAAFDCATAEVQELPPGKALLIDPDGRIAFADCLEPAERRSCVFERIYFSRPNDADIYRERKRLGGALAPRVLDAVASDFDNTFFCHIPNSAQVAFLGLFEALNEAAFEAGKRVRFGQAAIKDAKFRTFIANAASRRELFMHVYDVTYGLVHPGSDTLVVIDDSIVRGNTMRNAILPILDRLDPRRIVVVSSAPPIKYPDGYGIDMATLQELVAFEALVDVLKATGRQHLLDRCYEAAKAQLARNQGERINPLKAVYAEVPESDLQEAIARRLTSEVVHAEVDVIFQSTADLSACCPDHTGDWYFTGDYPTPGGFRVVCQAVVNYMENRNERAY